MIFVWFFEVINVYYERSIRKRRGFVGKVGIGWIVSSFIGSVK